LDYLQGFAAQREDKAMKSRQTDCILPLPIALERMAAKPRQMLQLREITRLFDDIDASDIATCHFLTEIPDSDPVFAIALRQPLRPEDDNQAGSLLASPHG
jgi:hypothetical protein